VLQVDIFVNYDCDLQASNLFERTLRGLARIVRAGDAAPGMLHAMGPVVNVAAANRPKPHQLAADVTLLVVHALDNWAEPLKVRCQGTGSIPMLRDSMGATLWLRSCADDAEVALNP
jgi:hypothetical protein